MRWLYTIPLRIRSLIRRQRVEQDLDDEFRFHLEKRIEAGIDRGLAPEDARVEALRALDNISLRKEECRDMRGLNFVDNLAQDLKYAVRTLRKSPVFTAVAILSLALGIGANTAIFSVMDVLLLRPLPVKAPNGLVILSIARKDHPRFTFNYPMFELVRDRTQSFSETFAWSNGDLQTPLGEDMVHVPAAAVSGDYFNGLGVPPSLGRTLGREDDRAAGGASGPVAVISDGLWSRRYGRNPSVLGQSIVLNGVAVTIIGVMPSGFFGASVGAAPEVWVPVNLIRQLGGPGGGSKCVARSDCWFLSVMGRLKPGVSEQSARAELRTVSPGIMKDNNPPDRADRKAEFLAQVLQIEPGATGATGLGSRLRSPLQVLMALVGFVLLIACANMANLLTARAAARHKEVAIRLAMGAGRGRVIRQFLSESLLLAVAGAVGGFFIAIWATQMLVALVSSTAVLDLKPDWRVLLFTAAAAIASGVLFGLAPALRATRAGIAPALKERVSNLGSPEGRFTLTRVLLAAQMALSIVLLAAAGLLSASLVRLLTERMGFDPHDVTVVSLDTTKLPQKDAALLDLYGTILERAKKLPNVESVSLAAFTPLAGGMWDTYVTFPGSAAIPEDQRDPRINPVSPGFLRTMRIPLLAGRDFNEADTAQSLKVAIISESAARRWFSSGAVGADLILGMTKFTTLRVVGIAGDIKYNNLRDDIPPTMYLPYTQWNQTGFVALRTNVPVRQTLALFRDLLRQTAPGTPIRTIKTMDQVMGESLSTERLTAYLSLFFAGLALLLTAVGLYGILSYTVSRRTGEIGIRMALGAQRGNVIWLVIREAMSSAAFGAVAGVAVVVAASKLIANLLYGVKPHDPSTMALAVLTLCLVCAIAAWIPARRACRLDPMVALREE